MASLAKISYKATGKWLMASPSKVRPVADLIRKRSYTEALSILDTIPNKGARLIKKVLSSAGANALSENNKLEEDMLYIQELRIDDGPRMKRVWFRARGRTDMFLKRMCHIYCVVAEKQKKMEG